MSWRGQGRAAGRGQSEGRGGLPSRGGPRGWLTVGKWRAWAQGHPVGGETSAPGPSLPAGETWGCVSPRLLLTVPQAPQGSCGHPRVARPFAPRRSCPALWRSALTLSAPGTWGRLSPSLQPGPAPPPPPHPCLPSRQEPPLCTAPRPTLPDSSLPAPAPAGGTGRIGNGHWPLSPHPLLSGSAQRPGPQFLSP